MAGDNGHERLKIFVDPAPRGTVDVDIVYIDKEGPDAALRIIASRLDMAAAPCGKIAGC